MTSTISCLRRDELILVFKHLPLGDILKACQVSKRWNQIGCSVSLWQDRPMRDLLSQEKEFTVIDRSAWKAVCELESYGLEFEDGPIGMDKETYINLKQLAFRVKNRAGITLLTIPKGLTIEKLTAIASMHGIDIQIKELLDSGWIIDPSTYWKISGEIPNPSSYVVAISNAPIKWKRKFHKQMKSKCGLQRAGILNELVKKVFSGIFGAAASANCDSHIRECLGGHYFIRVGKCKDGVIKIDHCSSTMDTGAQIVIAGKMINNKVSKSPFWKCNLMVHGPTPYHQMGHFRYN